MRVKVDSAPALVAALEDLPDAEVHRVSASGSHTELILRVASRNYKVRAFWVGNGWPSEVRSALENFAGSPPRDVVFTARRFSPGALGLLGEVAANWADEASQARIIVPPGLLIVRDAKEKRSRTLPPQAVNWSRSAMEIAEFILHKRLTEFQTGRLAEETGWSAAQVSKVLTRFDESSWTERLGGKSGRDTRRHLVSPGAMLDSWAAHVGESKWVLRRAHAASRDLVRFAHMRLQPELRRWEWALTTWSGLQLTAPFTTSVPTLHLYVSHENFSALGGVMEAAGLREVEDGSRVEFRKADFRLLTQPGKPSGIPVTSRPRLYADLLSLRGRGVDSAQHYREVALDV